jgi:hypothetical protein
MAWTRHGYWYGPLPEPTEGPPLRARCGGPGMCIDCMRQAYSATVDELAQRRKQVEVLTDIVRPLVPLWDAEKHLEPERYREPLDERLEFYASEYEDLRGERK